MVSICYVSVRRIVKAYALLPPYLDGWGNARIATDTPPRARAHESVVTRRTWIRRSRGRPDTIKATSGRLKKRETEIP